MSLDKVSMKNIKLFSVLKYVMTVYLLIAVPPSSYADELSSLDNSNLSISSFGTLGVVYNNEEDLNPIREFGQPDTFHDQWSWKMDSVLGVQVNMLVSDTIDGAIQVVLKDRTNQSLDEIIEWAYLAWQPNNNLRIRGGRLGLDFYMLSDYRNVSFAYLWQRPPFEFYAPLFTTNIDGVDLTYQFHKSKGDLRARLFVGTNKKDIELATGAESSISLNPVIGGSISYEDDIWRLNAGIASTRLDENIDAFQPLIDGLNSIPVILWSDAPILADDIATKDKKATYYAIGATYDNQNWVLSSEIGYLETDWGLYRDTLSGYFSTAYRLGNYTPYIMLSGASPQEKIRNISSPTYTGNPATDALLSTTYNSVQMLYSNFGIKQRSISMGLRWDLYRNIALKFQWDHISIEDGNVSYWRNDTGVNPLPDTTVDLLSTSINWVF